MEHLLAFTQRKLYGVPKASINCIVALYGHLCTLIRSLCVFNWVPCIVFVLWGRRSGWPVLLAISQHPTCLANTSDFYMIRYPVT